MTCGGGHWDAGAGGAGSAHGAATSTGSRPDRASDCMGEILAKHMATAVGANPSCGRLMAFLSGGGGGRRRRAQAGSGGSVAGAAALGGASNGTSEGDSVRMGDKQTWTNRANQARDKSGRAASVGAGRVWGTEAAAVVKRNLGTAGAGCGHGGAISRGRGREASSDGTCRRVTMRVTAGAGADPSRSPLPQGNSLEPSGMGGGRFVRLRAGGARRLTTDTTVVTSVGKTDGPSRGISGRARGGDDMAGKGGERA